MPRVLRPGPPKVEEARAHGRRLLLGPLSNTFSDEEMETIVSALDIIDFDYGAVVAQNHKRLARVADELETLVSEGGSFAVNAVLGAVNLPAVDAHRLLVRAVPRFGTHLRSLKSYLRQTERLSVSTALRTAIHAEIAPRIKGLETAQRLLDRPDLRTLKNPKQNPFVSRPIVNLAQVLLDAEPRVGGAKREAFRRTASFLRVWDPELYGTLTDEQVRLRYQHAQKKGRQP